MYSEVVGVTHVAWLGGRALIPGNNGQKGKQMLFMVIETFRRGKVAEVYGRFQERGRLAPEGLDYVASWVAADLTRCFQVMECNDEKLLEQWMSNWRDLVDFQVIPVMTSGEAASAVIKQGE